MRTGLDAFRDLVTPEVRAQETVGRSWTVKELRRKNYDDLHRLWLVLYKEKNMLLTEKQLARRKGGDIPQTQRWHKVKKSMGAIRCVLGERMRERNEAKIEKGKVEVEAARLAAQEAETTEFEEKEWGTDSLEEGDSREDKEK